MLLPIHPQHAAVSIQEILQQIYTGGAGGGGGFLKCAATATASTRRVYLNVELQAHWLLMEKGTNQQRHASNDVIISD